MADGEGAPTTDPNPQANPQPTTGDPTGTNGGQAEEKKFTQAELNAAIDARIRRERDAAEAKAKKDKEAAEAEALKEQNRFKELAEQHEARVKELEAEVAARDHAALKAKVAAKHKLPDAMAARLLGTTEDELEADAKELAKVVTESAPPQAGNGPAPRPAGAAGQVGVDDIIKQKRASGAYGPF